MELGRGFAFVERQQHIVTDTSDFYIDLVFYNYNNPAEYNGGYSLSTYDKPVAANIRCFKAE